MPYPPSWAGQSRDSQITAMQQPANKRFINASNAFGGQRSTGNRVPPSVGARRPSSVLEVPFINGRGQPDQLPNRVAGAICCGLPVIEQEFHSLS